jgi:tetratricopeptide (TPR) repeat protein
MTSRHGTLRRVFTLVPAVLAAAAFVGTVFGQPLQNPYENPFDTPSPKAAQPAPGTAAPDTTQADRLPPELRGLRTPDRAAPSGTRPGATRARPGDATEPFMQPETRTPGPTDDTNDNPFGDDPIQPDDAATKPSPSTRPSTQPTRQPQRDPAEPRPRDETGTMPESDGYSEYPEGVDPELLKKIDALIAADKFTEVIPILEGLVKERPDLYLAWNNLGTAYRRVGRYDDAIAVFGAMADAAGNAGLPKEQGEAHLMRGISWFYKGEPRIAIAEFEQAVSATIAFEDPRPEFWKGLAYAQQGRYRDAITAYSNSLRFYNAYTLARNNRGLAYLAIGEVDLALADFDEVIRQTPRDATAYYKRAIALGRRGDLREAVASYDNAIRLNSDFAPSYYNRGLLHRRLGNAQQADADLAKARKLNPQVESLARPQRLARR